MKPPSNKITGPNLVGPRQFLGWTPLAARVGQLSRCRMKYCPYCGRQNEDSAVGCAECGTTLDAPGGAQDRKAKTVLCSPGGWICVLAAIVVLQGLLRLEFTPYDPNLGEGDYKRVSAALYFWLSLGIGLVLFGYGFYLIRRKSNEHAG